MPVWQPRLLVDEGLPFLRVAEIFSDCEVFPCEVQAKDQAIAAMARDENALIVCSDNDFFGGVSRRWMQNQPHAMGSFRAIRVVGIWTEAEVALKRWRDATPALVEIIAPHQSDCLLIEIGPRRMYVISPDFSRPPIGC